MSNVSDGIVAN